MKSDSLTYEDIYSRNVTGPEATTTSSSADSTSFHINVIIAATTVILSVTLLIFIFLIAKKLHSNCCQPEPELGIYGIVSDNHSLCNESGHYGSHTNRQSELSPIIDVANTTVSENASLWYYDSSEYDNLSLNPEIPDSAMLDSPPDYEHPPAYESATRRSSRIVGNYEDI